ncbi:TetR/AcrR family transcriptional regulator [Thalassolituus pacificus]|uniref:TetR/AcrR family transcriptional regulator n=1 Tax=Thalassolituus pacificus TaxID=2975440 RepID=A0A9X3AE86_9GAMM|nr:TetR/AcrR family transcriptional regulator [Thalassolituus pacificus]MCT7357947.1 TetR/AcrR family transcriptional regulator [Thalassolituus pacificus]
MPKKPFTAEEIAAQRERIMDSASSVMAEVGFHHLSMRKLASQLGMTASNIYNYFPNKESLFIHTRRRGFDLAFADINEQMSSSSSPTDSLYAFAGQLIAFAQRFPGYYQLMFQPPLLSLDETEAVDQDIQLQVGRLVEEWQRHLLSLLSDAVPSLAERSEAAQQQLALFFIASIHGLIDSYRYRALPMLLAGVDLIPDEVVQAHISWLLSTLERQSERVS